MFDKVLLWYSGFALILIATFRLLGEDTDYQHYFTIFHYGQHAQESTKEFAFIVFRYITHEFFFSSYYFFLFLYALLGVTIKLLAFYKYSAIPFVSLILYVLIYFPLHDYTQIRVGVASAILLFVVGDLSNGYYKAAIAKVLFAALFHWVALSALLFIVLYRIIPLKLMLVLPVFGFVLSFAADYIYQLIGWIFGLNEYLDAYYQAHSGHYEKFNVYNLLFIMTFLLWAGILYFTPKSTLSSGGHFSVSFAVLSFSLFFYLSTGFMGMPVITHRVFELFNIVMLLLLPNFIYLFASREKVIPVFIVSVYGVAYFYHLFVQVRIFPAVLL